ncbi:immunoglobulin superfamily member 8 [Elgaria multicarinata webbii]|uniref:immunoglobulin superfamily member 8 n=1 Tax=Elgaria multicarinata webbii TaxID=159646 RepID=UPI002FCD2EA5
MEAHQASKAMVGGCIRSGAQSLVLLEDPTGSTRQAGLSSQRVMEKRDEDPEENSRKPHWKMPQGYLDTEEAAGFIAAPATSPEVLQNLAGPRRSRKNLLTVCLGCQKPSGGPIGTASRNPGSRGGRRLTLRDCTCREQRPRSLRAGSGPRAVGLSHVAQEGVGEIRRPPATENAGAKQATKAERAQRHCDSGHETELASAALMLNATAWEEASFCRGKGPWMFEILSDGREVHLPPGPLYRVEGTAVSIPCNVSEYEGPTLQQFEWFVYRPAAPDISIGVISTKDPKFPYAIFGPRVQAGNVSIQRVRGDAVELRIKEIRVEDMGIYECYTPTTDSKYHGTYSAKVELRVIPNRLSVAAVSPSFVKPPLRGRGAAGASPPLQRTLLESQDLRLACRVASETQQHTHLSVSFGFSAPETPGDLRTLQEVIGVRRDFAVEAGRRFAERHGAHELSLTKLGDQQYQMELGGLRPEDSGRYHCTVGEWIQDPDGSWQKIAEKRLVLAQVTVQTIASQLAVAAGPPSVRVSSGEALELLCNVSGLPAPPSPRAAYSVAWELSKGAAPEGRLVARLEADGATALGESYANRNVGQRHVSLQKLGSPPGSHLLRIESTQPGDVGTYQCVVRAFVRSSIAELREVAVGRSQALVVDMKSEAVLLEASAWLPAPTIYRGDTAEVRCNVSVESTEAVHLALGWWAELPKRDSQPRGAMLATVSREGVADLGRRASGGAVSVDKVGPLSYRLRLHGVQPSDEGKYHCAVTAWVRYPDLSWYNAGSAKSNLVTVYPYALPMDTLFIPFLVGISSALFMGVTILVTVTCCFMKRLRKR